VPLIVTPGAATAEAYASVAEMDAFIGTNPYASGWSTVPTSSKENYGRMAARLLDGMPAAWTGAATNPAVQALGWPRGGMKNRNGYAILSSVIPGDLKNAQAEYARLLSENDLSGASGASIAESGIGSVSAAGVSVSFKSVSKAEAKSKTYGKEDERHGQVPASVIGLLVPSWLLDPRDKDVEFSGFLAEVL
jgi:hypothetical protein